MIGALIGADWRKICANRFFGPKGLAHWRTGANLRQLLFGSARIGARASSICCIDQATAQFLRQLFAVKKNKLIELIKLPRRLRPAPVPSPLGGGPEPTQASETAWTVRAGRHV